MIQHVVAEYSKILREKARQTLLNSYFQIFKTARGWGREAMKEAIIDALKDGLSPSEIADLLLQSEKEILEEVLKDSL